MPEKIVVDVNNEYVSVGEAARTYGVVVDPVTHAADIDATNEKRAEIRAHRLKNASAGTKAPKVELNGAKEIFDWGGSLQLVEIGSGERFWKCGGCDHVLGESTHDWKSYAARGDAPMSNGQPVKFASKTKEFGLREFYCPECAELLEVLNLNRNEADVETFRYLGQ